MLDIYWS